MGAVGSRGEIRRRAGASSWDDRDERTVLGGGEQPVGFHLALAPKVLVCALSQVGSQPIEGGIEDRFQLGRAGSPWVYGSEGMARASNSQQPGGLTTRG